MIAIILLIIPFFWFKPGEVNYGGDSTRLYFYDPWNILTRNVIYSVGSFGNIGEDSAFLAMAPFLFVLSVLKEIFGGKDYLLNNFWHGLILSGGFTFVYLICLEIIPENRRISSQKGIAIIGGLFYILSPILIYSWDRALESISQLLAYPAVFFFFLRYLKSGKKIYLFPTAIFFLLFSINFSYWDSPYLLPFCFFGMIFFYFYARVFQQINRFFKGAVLISVFFCLISFFHLVPQFLLFFNPTASTYKSIFDEQTRTDRGFQYFLSVQPHVRLGYNLANQPQYVIEKGYSLPFENSEFNFGIKYLFLFLGYPAILCWGMILGQKTKREHRALQNLLLAMFLLLLFFMTANITALGQNFYKSLFNLPGFSMFRSFYSKFAVVFVFYYALFLAVSLAAIFERIGFFRKKNLLFLGLAALIIFSGWPLISGQIVNGTLWLSKGIKIPIKIDSDYGKFLQEFLKQKLNSRVLGLPLAGENYQIIGGVSGGAYLGPPTLTLLTGRPTFSSLRGINFLASQVKTFIEEKNYQSLNHLLGLLNIRYLFYNQDKYITYDNFPGYPYSQWEKKIFPNQESIKKFIQDLKFQEIISLGNYHLYSSSQPLPLFYSPQEIICTNGGIGVIENWLTVNSYQSRPAFFLKGLCPQEKPNIIITEGLSNDLLKLEAESRLVEEKITYPFVKERKGFLRRLALKKEDLEEWLSSGNQKNLIDKKLFYANKRVEEAISFNDGGRIFSLYQKKLEEVISLVRKIDDPIEQWQTAFLLKERLEDNREKLTSDSVADAGRWQTFIDETIKQTEVLAEQFKLKEREFSLTVAEDGDYSIFLQEQSQLGTKRLAESLSESQWFIDNKELALPDLNFQLDEDGWIKSERVNLSSGEHKLILKFNSPTDLLAKSDFKTIPDWQPGVWYRLEGKAKPGSGIKLALEEEYLEEIPKNRLIKIIDPDPVSGNFELYVRPSESALSAKIRVEGSGKLERLQVFPVLEPRLILASKREENVSENSHPKISFTKINPTKYYLRIEGAKKPYFLVFSQNYYKFWKLYLNKGEIFEPVLASYFGGEIKEVNNQNLFINQNIFETLGHKPIAEDRHFLVNGYANAWYITPKDTGGKETYELIVEYTPQRLVYVFLGISVLTFIGAVVLLLRGCHLNKYCFRLK